MPSSERFEALPLNLGDKWTKQQVKTLVRVGWVNLSVLATSASRRFDQDSIQIKRDHKYFRLQFGGAGVLEEKDFDHSPDISPLIDGLRRSHNAANGRDLSISSMLGRVEPLSRANRAEADRLSTFIDILERHSVPFPFDKGTQEWVNELKRLEKTEIKVTSEIDPGIRHPDQIIRFNEAEALRRLSEMKLLSLDTSTERVSRRRGGNRWVTAANIAGPIAAAAGIIAMVPEARETAAGLAVQAIDIAKNFLATDIVPMP